MTTPHGSIACALYARYSTDMQDARSIDDQLRRCRKFAADHGYTVAGEFVDHAVSGKRFATREGWQHLLRTAEAKPRPFSLVLVDDQSRLGRDLAKTLSTVLIEMESLGLAMVDCTTGTHSNTKVGRSMTGLTAIVNDQFLQMVRAETHRGLEGRAVAGFHTGGRCYGFTTVEEKNPVDPSHPRRTLVVAEDEAGVVRRVFDAYATGMSLDTIVTELNASHVPPPRAASWSKNQIHYMLRNERYLGRVTWNRREWFTDPKTETRRYRQRPASEWTTTHQAALQIVPDDTWTKVQARHTENSQGSGRPARKGIVHPLSSLLRCGACGSTMTIVGGRTVGLERRFNYGCGARQSRGAAACSNKTTVSEARMLEAAMTALRSLLASPRFMSWVEDEVAREHQIRLTAAAGTTQQESLEAEVHRAQKRVDNIAEAICSTGLNDILAAKLRAEETKLLDAKQRLAAASAPKKIPNVPAVSATEVARLLERLDLLVSHGPAQAKQLLADTVETIVLIPGPNGYSARLVLRNETAALASGRFVQSGCGGRI